MHCCASKVAAMLVIAENVRKHDGLKYGRYCSSRSRLYGQRVVRSMAGRFNLESSEGERHIEGGGVELKHQDV